MEPVPSAVTLIVSTDVTQLWRACIRMRWGASYASTT
jgi:hypothetical protein